MIDSIHFSRIAFLAEGLPFAGQSTRFFHESLQRKRRLYAGKADGQITIHQKLMQAVCRRKSFSKNSGKNREVDADAKFCQSISG